MSFGVFAMTFSIVCLAPALRRGADPEAVSDNLRRIETAWHAVDAPSTRLVLMPSGCLSGGAGFATLEAASAAVEPLRAWASGAEICIAGAERIAGQLHGFLIGPHAASVSWQASIAEGVGTEVAVLDSSVGKIACLPGADILHPEYVRLALFAGAEIILNPTEERSDDRSAARHFCRGARAWENLAVVASCAAASSSAIGRSMQEIWNHSGHLLAASDGSATTALIDLKTLRTRRAEPWINFPAQLRTALYAREFALAAERNEKLSTEAAQTPPPEAIEAYDVLMMQAHQNFVAKPETRDATIADNMQRALGLARLFAMRPSTKLVVFPEFFLQGSDGAHPHEYWERCGIRIPGPETEQLAAFAKACGVYVSGAVLEYDPSWPRRYFNTSLIIAPTGEIVLRYRKLQCADLNGLLNITTPGNIYSDYVARYGIDSLIPVIDTPIGKLGTLICFDSNWPELWRSLALRGAEVICNPTSEIHSNRRPYWYQAKRAHAAQNMLYVASANAGSEQFFPGAPITAMNRGHSALIDYNGELVAYADGPGVIPLLGRIELGALRRARAALADDPRIRFRPESVVRAYADFPGFPLDCFLGTPMEEAAEGPKLVAAQIATLQARGVLTPP